MEIVKNFVEEDIILSNHELSDKEIIKVYSAQVKKLINRLSFEREKKNAVWDLYDQQEKELEIYKKALELACDQMDEGDVIRFCDEKGTQVNNNEELKNYYLQRAKEKIDEQKTSEKEKVK